MERVQEVWGGRPVGMLGRYCLGYCGRSVGRRLRRRLRNTDDMITSRTHIKQALNLIQHQIAFKGELYPFGGPYTALHRLFKGAT